MNEIPFLKAWVLFFVVALVGGFFVGMAVGFVLGVIMGASGTPLDTIKNVCGIAGFIVGMPVSFFSYKWSVTTYILPQVQESLKRSAPQEVVPAGPVQ